ncbi:YlxM family DNA-binding protein [Anaeropeptidivorans aminofermentans]|uniref:YlxM family DNA-binding protein n=1 Tax=Anaeropeptidivorans aminofermentans TaxID=2934315 RepID=UPI0020255295|nr:hypothetical protein [Anaeropeptidivorans aminofermentans]MBE6013657.1 hypothetical protein [Lachnospiraceae bacterium]
MDSILFKSLIYDFYNELLTEKQKTIYELYNHFDMSLSEIAQNMDITPQGVSDILRRSEKVLNNYENKLNFVQNYLKNQKELNEISVLIDKLDIKDKDLKEEIQRKINLLKE